MVSFIGAGGKTSLITSIALELCRKFSLAVTTTTKVFPFDSNSFDNFFGTVNDYISADKNRNDVKIPAFFSLRDSEGKCLPPSTEELARLAETFDVVLIEADGAHGKSLKRPRVNEPAVPWFSKKVVWVTGADVLGRKFSDELVFKLETFESADLRGEDEIDFCNLRRALYAKGGYLDKLADQEIYLMINKVDSALDFERDSVRRLWHTRLSGLVLSGLDGRRRYFEEITNQGISVATVILAAGLSERFGSQKLLAKYKGSPLICHAVNAALGGGPEKLFAVIPDNSPVLREVIESCGPVEIVENPHARLGISSSIKAGLERLTNSTENPPAMMLLLADMPNVDSDLVKEVLFAFRNSGTPISAPFEDGRFGHPVIFHPVMFGEISGITGDTGCREILRRDPEMVKVAVLSQPGTQKDIDTPADIKRIDLNGRILQSIP
ncbi:MAG: selenium cofactor biosynthesis protein YqeC [bacterium]|nr:selenium cofactor biosynthesis protein YqeC [bacterium]